MMTSAENVQQSRGPEALVLLRPARTAPDTPSAQEPRSPSPAPRVGRRGPRYGGAWRIWRWLLIGSMIVSAIGLVVLVRRAPWAGPALADGLRAVIGDQNVTRLEEFWAGVEDRWLRFTRMPPRRLGDASPALAPALPIAPESGRADAGPAGALPTPSANSRAASASTGVLPAPAVPPFPEVAAVDDGAWYPVQDPERPLAAPFAYRTLIHPDPERTFAELFVVAMPTAQIELHAVAGTVEPESSNPEAARLEARGLIAPGDEPELLAAFNGGFKARHGQHGMVVAGVELLPLRVGLCTIMSSASGGLHIASWKRSDTREPGAWYRQTPPCMLEQGVLHPGLADPSSRKWGATLEGETVIRRSALALAPRGDILYMGVSNATTARALALGMQSAGGWTVAQLDVNWSYPRFLIFPRDASGARRAASLFQGFLFEPKEMLVQPSPRDFFYVVRRAAEP